MSRSRASRGRSSLGAPLGGGLLSVLLVLCRVVPAVAGPEAGDPAIVAQTHKEAAYKHLGEGDYEGAIAELEKAYEAVPHPTFLFNIAVAYQQWGADCAKTLAAFDRFFAACGDCEARAEADSGRKEARAKCGFRVESTPPGAQVLAEGRRVCASTPCSFFLPEKSYDFVLSKEGYVTLSRAIQIFPGGRIELRLEPVVAESSVPEATATQTELPPETDGAGPSWPWLAVSAGLLGGGLALDLAPDSARNGSLDALDFVPVGLYVAAGVGAVLAILPAL